MEAVDPIVFRLAIFVLAIFVGYYVVWSVTPALHTPLMSVTNAISSVIIVGAIIAAAGVAAPDPAKRAHDLCLRNVSQMEEIRRELFTDSTLWSPPAELAGAVKMCSTQAQQALEAQAQEEGGPSKEDVFNSWIARGAGALAAALAAVNIFGGFLVTQRMLAMYKKKERPKPATA